MHPIDQLEQEWRRIAPMISAKIRGLHPGEPVLTPFTDARVLVRFLQNHDADPRVKDQLLAALLRNVRTDPVAGRVVLQALLPGLKTIAAAIILDQRDRDELWQLLLSATWEGICSYPLERRPSRIAANLLRDARSAALREFGGELKRRCELPEQPLERVPAEQREVDLEAPLKRAVAAKVVTAKEAELILRTRVDGVPLAEIAAAEEIAYDTLRLRRRRAERHLLLFLGEPSVRFGGRKPHSSYAGTVEDGLRGSAGRGAVTHRKPGR